MKRTRILALMLCILLLFTLFSGCTKTETTPDSGTTVPDAGTTPPATTTTPDTTAPDTTDTPDNVFQYTGSHPVVEEKTTLEWYTTNGSSKDYDWSTKEWIHTLCDMANIELDMTLIDDSVYKDTITPMLAAGTDLPEVWQMAAVDWNSTYSDAGLVKEITEYVDTYGYNLSIYFDAYPSYKGTMTNPDGKIFYFPRFAVGDARQICLNFIRPYLDVLGWETPETIDDFYAYLCDVRDNDCNGDGDPTDEQPLFHRNGIRIAFMAGVWGCDMKSRWTPTEDGQAVQFSYTMDGYKQYLDYYNTLYEEDILNKDFDSADMEQQNNLHAYNRIGVTSQYAASLCLSWTREMDPEWNQDTDELLCFPSAPLRGGCDKPFWIGQDEVSPMFAINAELEEDKALAAFCFMDFVIGPEACEIRNYGTDKTKYRIDYDAGRIYKDDSTFYDENESILGYNFSAIPDNGKWYYPLGLMIYQGEAFTEYQAIDAAEQHTRIPTIVGCYKLPDEQEVIKQYETDLNTYCDEHFSGFISGRIDLAEWDNYVAACESLGINELQEVYTAIYRRLQGLA